MIINHHSQGIKNRGNKTVTRKNTTEIVDPAGKETYRHTTLRLIKGLAAEAIPDLVGLQLPLALLGGLALLVQAIQPSRNEKEAGDHYDGHELRIYIHTAAITKVRKEGTPSQRRVAQSGWFLPCSSWSRHSLTLRQP